jgi:APA family basic amino acid/polyamine antiporter
VLGALFPIELLSELISIGTLFAFIAVCASVILLRRTQPSLARPFRVPCAPLVGGLGAMTCGYLMFSLPFDTWLRFLGWMLVGLVLYFFYGFRRSAATRATGTAGGGNTPF